MKRWLRPLALVLVLAQLLMMTGCMNLFASDEEKIRGRIEEFVDCLNVGDFDSALDCLDSSSRSAYKAMFNITDALLSGLTGFGVSIKDLAALVLGLSAQDFFYLQIYSVTIHSDETATIDFGLSYMDPQTGAMSDYESISLPMIKEGWDWYIDARIDWSALMQDMY